MTAGRACFTSLILPDPSGPEIPQGMPFLHIVHMMAYTRVVTTVLFLVKTNTDIWRICAYLLCALTVGWGLVVIRLSPYKTKTVACRAEFNINSRSERAGEDLRLALFMAINDNGEGYLLIAEEGGSQQKNRTISRTVIDFDYSREGDNYDLRFREPNSVVTSLFHPSKEGAVRITLGRLPGKDYLLAVPGRSVMVCSPA